MMRGEAPEYGRLSREMKFDGGLECWPSTGC